MYIQNTTWITISNAIASFFLLFALLNPGLHIPAKSLCALHNSFYGSIKSTNSQKLPRNAQKLSIRSIYILSRIHPRYLPRKSHSLTAILVLSPKVQLSHWSSSIPSLRPRRLFSDKNINWIWLSLSSSSLVGLWCWSEPSGHKLIFSFSSTHFYVCFRQRPIIIVMIIANTTSSGK